MQVIAQKQNLSQRKTSVGMVRQNMALPSFTNYAHPILNLQRTIGNQAVLQLLRRNAKQEEINAPYSSARAVMVLQDAMLQPTLRLNQIALQPQTQGRSRSQVHSQTVRRPTFNAPEGRWVLISLQSIGGQAGGHGLVRVYQGTNLLHRFHASGGQSRHPTPVGRFRIDYRDLGHVSSEYGQCIPIPQPGERRHRHPRRVTAGRDACQSNERYQGADMHFFQRFAPKVGFHRGDPAIVSHGCIHLQHVDAATLWREISEGTAVIVCAGRDRCQWYIDGIIEERNREAIERNVNSQGHRRR